MTRKNWILLLCLLVVECVIAQNNYRIVSYNVENLFDTQHDSLKNDSSFLSDGLYHWTPYRYQTKLDRISQVITNISGWESVPIVGLCEVENDKCLRDLCYKLRRFCYKYIHYESEDERGVDVALLYDTTKVKVLTSNALKVPLKDDKTRDILYVNALINNLDTLHTFLCHLPSKLGGSVSTEHKRKIAKQVLQNKIDSIFSIQKEAKIVVMGDMNSEVRDDLNGMYNLMGEFEKDNKGTHKYHGIWSCLDQFYVSSSLNNTATVHIFSPSWLLEEDMKYLNYKPRRTYVGYRYHDGYSDHLPIILNF